MSNLFFQLRKISVSLNWISLAVLLGVMAVIITLDASMRYIMGKPFKWGTDFNTSLLTIIVFFSMAKCWIDGGHIRMTILYDKIGSRGKEVLNVLAAAGGLFFWGLLLYQSLFVDIAQSVKLHEVTDDSGIILWPVRLLISVGMLIFVLEMLVSFYKSLMLSIKGQIEEQ